MAHNKNKTFKTPNSEWVSKNLVTKVLGFIKYVKELGKEKEMNFLPIDDPNKLGVAYTTNYGEASREVAIAFFDRTKVTSFMDVLKKAQERQNDAVGEDCLYYPEFVGMAICPNWIQGAQNCGTLDIDMFIERLDRAHLLTE